MSAIFDFSSLITVFVLSICTTTYIRELRPAIFDTAITNSTSSSHNTQQQHHSSSNDSLNDMSNYQNNNNNNEQISNTTTTSMKRFMPHHHRDGMMGFLWKLSRIGERCSPYISIACIVQALNILFWK